MEIWIVIGAFLAFGFIGYLGCVASEMNKWMRQRHLRELKLAMEHPEFFSRTYDVSADEIRRAMHIYTEEMEEVTNEAIKEARE